MIAAAPAAASRLLGWLSTHADKSFKSPDLRMTQPPRRIGRQRRGQIGRTDTAHLIAILIHDRNKCR